MTNTRALHAVCPIPHQNWLKIVSDWQCLPILKPLFCRKITWINTICTAYLAVVYRDTIWASRCNFCMPVDGHQGRRPVGLWRQLMWQPFKQHIDEWTSSSNRRYSWWFQHQWVSVVTGSHLNARQIFVQFHLRLDGLPQELSGVKFKGRCKQTCLLTRWCVAYW